MIIKKNNNNNIALYKIYCEKLKSHKSPGIDQIPAELINPLNPELNSICHFLALLELTIFSTLAG